MSAKSKTTKLGSQGWTHKSVRNELERSIALMVLSNPSLEHEIVSNFLNRQGYVVQGEDESDKYLNRVYGLPLPSKKELALREKFRVEAEQLYKLAQEMRAENKAHTAEIVAEKKALKLGRSKKKDNQDREKNVDRLLKQVLNNAGKDKEQNKNDG